ncbi:hypothetical protein BGZ74_000999 [Mortierella antarctica]|nr:hypothetical protein BGZ74_000999 [Mortierella antarctica]
MLKKLVLLLAVAVCSTSAQIHGDHRIEIKGGALGRTYPFRTAPGTRLCVCLANTQVRTIQGLDADRIRLLSSNTCAGPNEAVGGNATVPHAMWVNSIEFGSGGVQRGPNDCPDYFD